MLRTGEVGLGRGVRKGSWLLTGGGAGRGCALRRGGGCCRGSGRFGFWEAASSPSFLAASLVRRRVGGWIIRRRAGCCRRL